MFVGGGYTWFRPISLDKLLELKKAFPKATIVMGSQTVVGQLFVYFPSVNFNIKIFKKIIVSFCFGIYKVVLYSDIVYYFQ